MMCTKEDAYKQEALNKGFQLINFEAAGKAKYKRIQCGHESVVSIANMRHQPRTDCRQCSNENVTKIFQMRGLEIVGEISSLATNVIVKECGHNIVVATANVLKRTSRYKCHVCDTELFETRCREVGLEVLENPIKEPIGNKSSPTKTVKFKRIDCGHEYIALRHHITKIGACQVCESINRDIVYKQNGLELIKSTDSAIKAEFRFIECNHTRILHKSAALRGNVTCHECNITSFSKPSKVYAIEFKTPSGEVFIKYGYGKNVQNRIREYGIKDLTFTKILYEVELPTGYAAMFVEKAVHKTFCDYVFPANTMKPYFSRQGFTECYPRSLLDELIYCTQQVITDLPKSVLNYTGGI